MRAKNLNHVSVVGLARNVESTLPAEIVRLRKLLEEIFVSISFFVVESDSSDATVSTLEKLSQKIPDFNYVSLGSLEQKIPQRIKRLIACRNTYIRWLRKSKADGYVIVVDFDIRNTHLSSNSIEDAIKALPEAAGIFANQAGRYFDIYALRCENWSETDCLSEYWELRKSLSPADAKQRAIWSKMKKISKRSNPIEVDSAFGGFGIYHRTIFQMFDYEETKDSGVNESEHVNLHRKIRGSGGHLYIYPPLLNFGWNPHNLSSFRLLRSIEMHSRSKWLMRVRRVLRDNIR